MLPNPPTELPYMMRPRQRLKQSQDENRKLRLELTNLRRELNTIRLRLRRRLAS
jgi:hypothetical protein